MNRRRIRRVIVGILAGLLLLCVVAVGVSALINSRMPTGSEVVDRLGGLEQARLAEALHLRQELGESLWPGWGKADIPVILYNEEYAFLVGYPDPPPGWVKVPNGSAKGGPWEPVPGDIFEGQTYYRQRLPASGVTPEAFTVLVGDRWAASMQTKEWMNVSLMAQVREGLPSPLRPIFPYWLAVQLFDSDWYIADVLHESFHAYQGMVAAGRLENAEMAIRSSEGRYPWADSGLQGAWQAELGLLADAVQATSDDQAAELARQFLAQREQRRESYGLDSALVDYERQREWLEGLAKYVELSIWRQAATTPDYEPLPALATDPEFKGYAAFEQRWAQELGQLRRAAAQDDGRFYYTGMAQAVLLDRLTPGWKAQVMDAGVYLEDMLGDAIGSR